MSSRGPPVFSHSVPVLLGLALWYPQSEGGCFGDLAKDLPVIDADDALSFAAWALCVTIFSFLPRLGHAQMA